MSPPHTNRIPAIPLLAFLLAVWGGLTIISSQSGAGQPLFLAGKQLIFILIGLAAMAASAAIPFAVHLRLANVYAAFSILLLLALPLFGIRINGMLGWYEFGGFFFQPSELAKSFFLLFLVKLAAKPGTDWRKFGLLGGAALCWIAPVLWQPDFGTATVYLLGFAALYLLAGGAWRCFFTACGAMALTAALFVAAKPYAWRRIVAFVDPDLDPGGASWHIRQFQLAIAHGGFFGAKLGGAIWSNAYLPLPYNDSAYATMAETLGLVGALPVPFFYALLFYFLMKSALRRDLAPAARLYLAGAAVLPAIQALLHLSVNVGLLPPTGLTLPLVSYGGSSMVGTFLLLGLAMSAEKSVAITPEKTS